MKKAVALLITLFFIMMLTILIGYNQEITEKSFQNIEKKRAAVQANITLQDVVKIVERYTATIENPDGLNQLLQTPPVGIRDDKSEIEIYFTFEHGSNRLNINHLMDYNATSKRYTINDTLYSVLDTLLIRNNVLDSTFLMTLFLDTIDTDTYERNYESEIAATDPFFKQGGIYSKEHFQRILDYYQERRDDLFVDEIDWNKLIQFHGNHVDYNHMDETLIDLLLGRSSEQTVDVEDSEKKLYEDYKDLNASGLFSEDELERLESFNVNFYEPLIQCNFGFKQFGYNYTINFLYDIKSKEAYRFAIQN